MPSDRILLISPVYNEREHIERVVHAVAAQEHRPARWIVIDDRSTDGTRELLRGWEERLDFLEVQDAPAEAGSRERDGLAAAREAIRFNQALSTTSLGDYVYIGKLDGDVELPPGHFRELLARMDSDPSLGIAGCHLIEPSGDGWVRLRIPDYHVHGAVKLYRRDCFTAIGGMEKVLGWDVIDETYARMRGYRTQTFSDLKPANHLRPEGSAAGRIRGRMRAGEVAYLVRYPLWWVAPRAGKVALTRPYGIAGVAFLYGYLRSAARRREPLGDEAYERFITRELSARIRRALRA